MIELKSSDGMNDKLAGGGTEILGGKNLTQ
jgi:hypothetical protein